MSSKAGIANLITGLRFLCSIALLPCPTFSPPFYALYLVAGSTDMIDGTIARRTNTVSAFGARLDTAADFVLVAVRLIKLVPMLDIPAYLSVWTVLIAFIKIINIVSDYVVQKRFVTLHTVANKITGALLFVLPLTLRVIEIRWSGTVACMAATFAAVQEGHAIRMGREVL